jgi:uncharacterized protein (TIGR03790 family)
MIGNRHRSILLLAFSMAAWIGSAAPARADLTDRVVVLRNGTSPVSRAIADDYARRRGVRNELTIACPDAAIDAEAETIDVAAYRREIEGPLKGFLASHPEVDFIVLTKGIPVRLIHAADPALVGRYSLDSRLAALDYDTIPHAIRVDISDRNYNRQWRAMYGKDFHALAWANRYWNSTERFSHLRFGGYLVTRLDGYSQADAMALTTRSLEAEQGLRSRGVPDGEILLDASLNYGFGGGPYNVLQPGGSMGEEARITSESNFGGFNADMRRAADILMDRGIPVELEATGRFTGVRAGLMGYVSWGSNDGKFDAAAYHSLAFAPGALSETAVSTSGRTFLPTQGGQSLSADLIAQGVTGVKGYTDEPLLQAIASPSILFERYTRGWTLAESMYAASALVGWEDIVIGDPLGRAYPDLRK